jgi:hypothetical protein
VLVRQPKFIAAGKNRYLLLWMIMQVEQSTIDVSFKALYVQTVGSMLQKVTFELNYSMLDMFLDKKNKEVNKRPVHVL